MVNAEGVPFVPLFPGFRAARRATFPNFSISFHPLPFRAVSAIVDAFWAV